MSKKIFKHGTKKAIDIDDAILKKLGIDEKTVLEIKVEGNSLVITPVKIKKRTSDKTKKIREAYKKVAKKHKKAFAKLAKK